MRASECQNFQMPRTQMPIARYEITVMFVAVELIICYSVVFIIREQCEFFIGIDKLNFCNYKHVNGYKCFVASVYIYTTFRLHSIITRVQSELFDKNKKQ